MSSWFTCFLQCIVFLYTWLTHANINPLGELVHVPSRLDYRLVHVHVAGNQQKERNAYHSICIHMKHTKKVSRARDIQHVLDPTFLNHGT